MSKDLPSNRNLMEDFALCLRQSSGVWVGPYLVRTPAKERKVAQEHPGHQL